MGKEEVGQYDEICVQKSFYLAGDTHGSSLESVSGVDGSLDVSTEDGSSQSVDRVVGNSDQVLLVGELLQNQDGSEDFLSDNLGVGLDASEDGWLDEVTFVTLSNTSGQDVTTLALSVLDVTHDSVELELRDLRA